MYMYGYTDTHSYNIFLWRHTTSLLLHIHPVILALLQQSSSTQYSADFKILSHHKTQVFKM